MLFRSKYGFEARFRNTRQPFNYLAGKMSVISQVAGVTSSIYYSTYCQKERKQKRNKKVGGRGAEVRNVARKKAKSNEMKRSQTSHDPLIRGLNTADVFCRCNIIIFSMRT